MSKTIKCFTVVLIAILMIAVSGCSESIQNAKSSAVVYVPYYNESCATIAQIEGSDGKVYVKDIPPGGVGEIVVRRPAFSKGETVILVATSYDPPRGCDDYGRDYKEINFDDGDIDTDEWYIDLDSDHWKGLSADEQDVINSFWESQGVNLDVEVPKTEVELQ